jgi:hypothetical protein
VVGWIAVNHCVIDRQFGTLRNPAHGHERDLSPNAHVRVAGVVEARNIRFNLCSAARGDIQAILDLYLSGRHAIPDERERVQIHARPTFHGNYLARCDCVTGEKAATLDRACMPLRFWTEPASHSRVPIPSGIGPVLMLYYSWCSALIGAMFIARRAVM